MSESLLLSDIESWLRAHPGHLQARPRAELLAHLKGLGHSIGDRQMRDAYSGMDKLGS